jgi:hypothetical protein
MATKGRRDLQRELEAEGQVPQIAGAAQSHFVICVGWSLAQRSRWPSARVKANTHPLKVRFEV